MEEKEEEGLTDPQPAGSRVNPRGQVCSPANAYSADLSDVKYQDSRWQLAKHRVRRFFANDGLNISTEMRKFL